MKAAAPAAMTESRTTAVVTFGATVTLMPQRMRSAHPDITICRERTTDRPRAASHRESQPPPRLPTSAARKGIALKRFPAWKASPRSSFK